MKKSSMRDVISRYLSVWDKDRGVGTEMIDTYAMVFRGCTVDEVDRAFAALAKSMLFAPKPAEVMDFIRDERVATATTVPDENCTCGGVGVELRTDAKGNMYGRPCEGCDFGRRKVGTWNDRRGKGFSQSLA